eukprot:m.309987 g.309987  ORF g.309987 m.309987 type:complete len:185 (+) comp48955_c0_seq1:24-578(+)
MSLLLSLGRVARPLGLSRRSILGYALRRSVISSRNLSQEAVLENSAQDDVEKDYSPKIRQLVAEIGQLTLLEVADLNELLKKTLKIPDVPISMGLMPAANAPGSSQEQPVEEKTSFEVKLMGFADGKKAKVIKEIKAIIEGLNLVEAKKLVESSPQTIKKDVTKAEAEETKTILETAGATVEIV